MPLMMPYSKKTPRRMPAPARRMLCAGGIAAVFLANINAELLGFSAAGQLYQNTPPAAFFALFALAAVGGAALLLNQKISARAIWLTGYVICIAPLAMIWGGSVLSDPLSLFHLTMLVLFALMLASIWRRGREMESDKHAAFSAYMLIGFIPLVFFRDNLAAALGEPATAGRAVLLCLQIAPYLLAAHGMAAAITWCLLLARRRAAKRLLRNPGEDEKKILAPFLAGADEYRLPADNAAAQRLARLGVIEARAAKSRPHIFQMTAWARGYIGAARIDTSWAPAAAKAEARRAFL